MQFQRSDRRPPTSKQTELPSCEIPSPTFSRMVSASAVWRRGRSLKRRIQSTAAPGQCSTPFYRQELDRLLNLGVIKTKARMLGGPTYGCQKHDRSARLCVDYSTGLNDAFQLCQHPLPVPEDIFATLNSGHVFSQIGFSDAYILLELDNYSRRMCTIHTEVFPNIYVRHLVSN